MHDDGERRPPDVVRDEVGRLFADETLEQVLDGEAVGHELGGPQHETGGRDDVEQRVDQQGSVLGHADGGRGEYFTRTD